MTVQIKDYEKGMVLSRELNSNDSVQIAIIELTHIATEQYEFGDNLEIEVIEDWKILFFLFKKILTTR